MTTRERLGPDARDSDRSHLVESILSAIPSNERDRLQRLLRDGPALVERLTGERPHRAYLWRHYRDGIYGVRLAAVATGRKLLVSARMVAEHMVDVAAARRKAEAKARTAGRGVA